MVEAGVRVPKQRQRLERTMKTIQERFGLVLLLALVAPNVALAVSDERALFETDARDYEALAVFPSRSAIALVYYRHYSSTDKQSLSQDVGVLRGGYLLRYKNWSFVPIDLVLPVADLTVYEPVAAFAAPRTIIGPINGALHASGIGDLLFLPTIGYGIKEDKHHFDRTYFGFTLYCSFPTGQFDPTHLVNLGTNRYGFQEELAVGQRFLKIVDLELVGAATEYTDNPKFLTPTGVSGTARQHPTFGLTIHASVDLTENFLLAVSYYFVGYGQVDFSSDMLSTRAVPTQTVNRLRFTAGLRVEKKTLLYLQYSQDVATGGDLTITRFIGARISHVW
jgi:hypothetical protein